MDTYDPELGDLVFFGPDKRLISNLVARLSGQPIRKLMVSHCAIVRDVSPSGGVTVIENAPKLEEDWHDGDPIGGACSSSLFEICWKHGPRRMLVVRPDKSSESAVDTAAKPWLARSDYSIPLLLLAALASLLRELRCSERRRHYWVLVHRHARGIDDRARTTGVLEGTCTGTVAAIESCAGQDLRIKEPKCPGRMNVWRRGAHLIEQIEAMAAVASLEADLFGRGQVISERVTAALREAESRKPKTQRRERVPAGRSDTPGPPRDDAGEASPNPDDPREGSFGSSAAVFVLDQLRHVLAARRVDKIKVFRDLLITFHVLDELLDAPPDWDEPPGPDDDVFRPLMPLDLILEKYKDQVLGPFDPYEVR